MKTVLDFEPRLSMQKSLGWLQVISEPCSHESLQTCPAARALFVQQSELECPVPRFRV